MGCRDVCIVYSLCFTYILGTSEWAAQSSRDTSRSHKLRHVGECMAEVTSAEKFQLYAQFALRRQIKHGRFGIGQNSRVRSNFLLLLLQQSTDVPSR